MKKLLKVLALSLIVGLFGVVAVSSLMAAPSEIQSPIASTTFKASSGIRWNEGFGLFEVYDAAGVSHIASQKQIDTDGSTTSGKGRIASGAETYYIMQDIDFSKVSAANLEVGFGQGNRYSITSGLVNGRGNRLIGFPIKSGTTLFVSNGGTIRNLKIENPSTSGSSSSDLTDVGLIVQNNTGTIEDCETTLGAINVGAKNVGGIAFKSSGIIRNCTNNVVITSSGGSATQAAGIVAQVEGGEIFSNINNATIAGNNAAGIVGKSNDNTTINNNKNYGAIAGTTSGCGILAGGVNPTYAMTSKIQGNENFSNSIQATNKASIYIGGPEKEQEPEPNENDSTHPSYTPKYVSTLNPTSGIYYLSDDTFIITKMEGLAYIGGTTKFNTSGSSGTSTSHYSPTTSSKYYVSVPSSASNTITYKTTNPAFTPKTLANGAIFDGQGTKFVNFPLQTVTNGLAAMFSTIGFGATVRNINLTIPSNSVASSNTGVLCYSNSGTIEYCVTNGAITSGTGGAGGFAYTASSNGTFRSCTNNVAITISGEYLGGIVGYVGNGGVLLVECVNGALATLTSSYKSSCIGGIAGVYRSDLIVSDTVATLGGRLDTNFKSGIFECSNFAGLIYSGTSNVTMGGCVGAVAAVGYVPIINFRNESLADGVLMENTGGSKSSSYCAGVVGSITVGVAEQPSGFIVSGVNRMNINAVGTIHQLVSRVTRTTKTFTTNFIMMTSECTGMLSLGTEAVHGINAAIAVGVIQY